MSTLDRLALDAIFISPSHEILKNRIELSTHEDHLFELPTHPGAQRGVVALLEEHAGTCELTHESRADSKITMSSHSEYLRGVLIYLSKLYRACAIVWGMMCSHRLIRKHVQMQPDDMNNHEH